MPEIDFAGLRTAAEKAARQPEFSTVERRSGRLRARQHGATAVAAAVAVGLASATGYAALRPAPVTESAVRGMDPAPIQVTWVGSIQAGDAEHLYLTVHPCARVRSDCTELIASDDGGRTWQPRTLPEPGRIGEVLGPRLLLGLIRRGGTPPATRQVSVDGGRTWRGLTEATGAAAAVAPGHRGLCRPASGGAACLVHAVDPVTGQVAALAQQPPIDVTALADVPPAAGLWATGFDRSTRQPAVSWSHDGGRNWTAHTFPVPGPVPAAPELTTANGRTAYVSISDAAGRRLGYRTTDGGATWSPRPPDLTAGGSSAYVTADGAHVQRIPAPPIDRWVVSRDGGPYQDAHFNGIVGMATVPEAMDGGGYISYTEFDPTAIYLSDDGWTWRRVAPPR